MDPANYSENSLPKMEYNEKIPSSSYYIDDKASYSEFCDLFTEHISGDCHAITVDDEIVYNVYKSMGVRATIQENLIRNSIIENPHNLFVHLFCGKKSARVIVYMFGLYPWWMAVYYRENIKTLTVEYYNSQKYIDRFGK